MRKPVDRRRHNMQRELDAAPAAFLAGSIRSIAVIHSQHDGDMGIGLYLAPGDDRAKWVEAVTQLLYQVQHAD